MSLYHCIEKTFNWVGGSVKEMETLDSEFLLHLQFHFSTSCGPHCHSHKLHVKDYRNRKILLSHRDFCQPSRLFTNGDIPPLLS